MLITLAGMTISAILLHPAKHDAGISVILSSMVTDFKVLEHGANCDVPVKYIDFADGGTVFFFETMFPGLDQKEAFELWKQQLCYTYQKDLKFEDING